MFQGTAFNPGSWLWEANINYPFGAYYQTEVAKMLLDNNYTVIAPYAHAAGRLFWDTNVPGCAAAWQTCPDSCFMAQIQSLFAGGTFGPIDEDNVFATGISSGGYMTSRMAEAYNDPLSPVEGIYRFNALAIMAGSWCTCIGALCQVPLPQDLPSNHPPTLFLHGTDDRTVPMNTAVEYYDNLIAAGFNASFVAAENYSHEWIPGSYAHIRDYFAAYKN